MAPSPTWPVPLAVVGSGKGGTMVFKHAGKVHVACILKSTFQMVPGAPMKNGVTEDVCAAELHYDDHPKRSIRVSSDLAPHLPGVDVVMTGHACAPAGKPVNRQPVRLAIFHTAPLLDKTLHVYGDHDGSKYLPFERMPLVYERAARSDSENPIGAQIPNIVYPRNRTAVAGFAPISRTWPQRDVLRGSMSIADLEKPVVEYPPDFDWSYFQSAPPDQRIESIVGNEWIIIEGVHPELPRISSRLPSVTPIATFFGIDPYDRDYAQGIQLQPDIIRIDADSLQCTVISRGVFCLEDDIVLKTLRIAATVETEHKRLGHLIAPPAPKPGAQERFRSTATMRLDDIRQQTLRIEPVNSKEALRATLDLSAPPAAPAKVMPFIAQRSAESSSPPAAPIPGAPWAGSSVAKPPPIANLRAMTLDLSPATTSKPGPLPLAPPEPQFTDEVAVDEIAVDEVDLLENTAQPAAPVEFVSPPPTAAPTNPQPPKNIWADLPAEPQPAAVTPPPARIPTKSDANKSIYGFGPSKKKS